MKIKRNERQAFLNEFGIRNGDNYVTIYFKREEGEHYNALKHFSLSQKDKSVQKQIQTFCRTIGQCKTSFHTLFDSYNEYMHFTISDYDGMLKNKIFYKADRLCNAFIDSGKGFLDYIQNDWGPKNLSANMMQLWNAQRTDWFDSSLAYRVCYYLRNISEHAGNGMLFSDITINSDETPFIDLRVNKDNIFSGRNYGKAFIRKTGKGEDYWEKSGNLYINQYLPQYMIALMSLYKFAMSYYFSDNIEAIQKTINYCSEGPLSIEYWYTNIKYDDFMRSGELPISAKFNQGINIFMLSNLLMELKEDHVINIKLNNRK